MTLDDRLKTVEADRAALIARDLSLDERFLTVTELAARGRDRRFQVIFAGEFNSGKSTTINTLLGEPVMPMRVVEANAILTKISYADHERRVLHSADGGARVEVPYAEFAQHIVVDRKDRKKPNKWKKAELFYPLEILRQGIAIVDPPGTNALPEHQVLAVEEAGNSDAAVFLFFADQAFKESEHNFIVGCLDRKEAFWLVTHAERLDPEGVAELREEVGTRLGETRPYDTTIPSRIFFMDSARALRATTSQDDDEFTSGMAQFFRALGDFIAGDRHRARMQDLCAWLAEHLNALDKAAETQYHDIGRQQQDVKNGYEKLKSDLDAAARDADSAADRLTSHLIPLADTVGRTVRAKLRGLVANPPVRSSDITVSELTTIWMDFDFDGEKKERIVEEVRVQVVRHAQENLRDWFRDEVGQEIKDELDAELARFDQACELFEARLTAIRAMYSGLPLARHGHEPEVSDLKASQFADGFARTVRSFTGGQQVPTRSMSRTINIWMNTSYDREGSGTWADVKTKANEAFTESVSRVVLEQVADTADDLADSAREEMPAWLRRVEAAAQKAISDPRDDLAKTAQEGARIPQLQTQEKQHRRDQLAAHLTELSAFRRDLAALETGTAPGSRFMGKLAPLRKCLHGAEYFADASGIRAPKREGDESVVYAEYQIAVPAVIQEDVASN